MSALGALIVRGVILLLQVVPVGLSLGLARLMGDLAYLLGFRRHQIRANLDYIFGDELSDRRKRRIERSALRNVAMTAVEMLASSGGDRRRRQLANHVEWSPESVMEAAEQSPRPTLFCVAHAGNVDLYGQRWTTTSTRPLWVVMKPLENDHFNRVLVGGREKYGFGNISTKDPDAKAKINGVLQRGEALCILPDQNARKHGVVVQFLGKPASTFKGAAATYLRYPQCRLLIAVGSRPGDGRRHVCHLEEITDFEPSGDHDTDVENLTQRICDVMSKYIVRCPGSYLWLHRRWGRIDSH